MQVNSEIVRIESVLREVSAALGEHAEFLDAVVPSKLRNRYRLTDRNMLTGGA